MPKFISDEEMAKMEGGKSFISDDEMALLEKQSIDKDKSNMPLAIAAGGLQGASAGWADEIIAKGKSVVKQTPYKDELATTREQFKQIEAKNPKSYMAGDIGAGIGVGIGAGLVTGVAGGAGAAPFVARVAPWAIRAGIGAIEGAGRSESDTVSGTIGSAGIGGTIAAVLPSALTKGGKALKEYGEEALPKIAGYFNSKLGREEIVKYGAASVTKKILDAEKKALELSANGVKDKIISGSPSEIANKAIKYKNEIGNEISKFYDDAEKSIKVKYIKEVPEKGVDALYDLLNSGIEGKEIIPSITAKLNKLDPLVDKNVYKKVGTLMKGLEERDFNSVKDLWEFRKSLDSKIYSNNKLNKSAEAEKIVRDSVKEMIESKVNNITGLNSLNKLYGEAAELAKNTMSAATKQQQTVTNAFYRGGTPGIAGGLMAGPVGVAVGAVPSVMRYGMTKPSIANVVQKFGTPIGSGVEKVGEKMSSIPATTTVSSFSDWLTRKKKKEEE